MTRDEAQAIGYVWFETPPRAAADIVREALTNRVLSARCCGCRDYFSGPGYLEMESDFWFCPPCVEAMPTPEGER